MSVIMSLSDRTPCGSLVDRLSVRVAVATGRIVSHISPQRIRLVLTMLRTGSRPATLATAVRWKQLVMTASPHAAGSYGCLVRSLATVLASRMHGEWPTWCVGVRVDPPFGVHAWVEAEGQMVCEPARAGSYHTMVVV
ncbi:MAG: lasso peptide biosynthesis B2 protein [Mycobacterium sp.]|nr:lasso peptide biosynthesis B2 protein [Mycobacterium sp.]